MAGSITLSTEDGPDMISLGEVLFPQGVGDIGSGDPVRIEGENDGTTKLRNISIAIDGDVAQFTQLARDEEGSPGPWAEASGSIFIEPEEILPGEKFSFWAVAVYSAEDAEGHYSGDFVLRATSVGA